METDLTNVRQQAEEAELKQDWDEASRLRDIVALQLPSADFWDEFFAIRAVTRAGRIDDAFRRLCLLEIVPGTEPQWAMMRAEIEERRGRDADAVEWWRKAASLQPDPYWALFGLGRSLQRLGQVSEARRTMDLALALPSAEPLGVKFAAELGAEAKLSALGLTYHVDPADHEYRTRMTAMLVQQYFSSQPAGYLDTPLGRSGLEDHVSGRYRLAMNHVIPWLQTRFDLSGMTMIEIGSGTGSSTLALAQVAKFVNCYDINEAATRIARKRLDFWGVTNVLFHTTLFDDSCSFVQAGGQADAIMLYATLEHMTLDEALTILALAWRVLRPEGILVVAETPNRFSLVDQHTSWLPLFAQLPPALKVRYAAKSPREDFRRAIAEARTKSEDAALMMMTRWGSGISYHEFELAIGDGVHEQIVLDGYEPEITSLIPVHPIDTTLQMIFEQFEIRAHKAFTRRSLHLVLQKPVQDPPVPSKAG